MTWLGIDGGGTKTACTLYNESLQPLARTTFSTCHYAQAGADGMACIFRDCLAWARRHGLDRDGGVGLGICGYGEGAESDRAIESAVKAAVGTRPYALINDVDAAWAAGLNLADGIAVIAAPARSRLACETAPACVAAGGTTYWGTRAAVAGLARRPCAPSPAKATGATSAGLFTTPLNENSA